jgi:hypothetical protein
MSVSNSGSSVRSIEMTEERDTIDSRANNVRENEDTFPLLPLGAPVEGSSMIQSNNQPYRHSEDTSETESPLSYSVLFGNENTPLLQDYDSNDPPPEYSDPGVFGELPTYQDVQRESKHFVKVAGNYDEYETDYMSLFFFLIVFGIIALTILPIFFEP